MPRKPGSAEKIAKRESKIFTLWVQGGVELVAATEGQVAARCSFGGDRAPSFRGEEGATRALVLAALEAVRSGALGESPGKAGPLRLP